MSISTKTRRNVNRNIVIPGTTNKKLRIWKVVVKDLIEKVDAILSILVIQNKAEKKELRKNRGNKQKKNRLTVNYINNYIKLK